MKLSLTFGIVFSLIFSTSVSLFAQNTVSPFEKEWEQYNEFKNNDKPKSAVEVTKKIYESAKSQKLYPEMLRALFVMSSERMSFEDDDSVNLVELFENELKTSPEPARSIIASMYGNLVWNYVQQNRWSIQKRTKRMSTSSNDLTTMSIDELLDKTTSLYDYSIQSKEILQKISLRSYKDVLNSHDDIDKYRNTLYDLLANRAIKYYLSGLRNSLELPGEAFSLTSTDALKPSSQFVTITFTTKDTASLQYKALKVLQEIERTQPPKSIPLGDAILLRLETALGITLNSEKNSEYFKTLQSMLIEFSGNEIESDVYADLADYYLTKFPKDSILSNGNNGELEALSLAKLGKQRHPNTRGSRACAAIEGRLLYPSITSNVLDHIYPYEPFLSSVQYRNFTSLTTKVYKIDVKTSFMFPFTSDPKKKFLEAFFKANKPINSFVTELPPTSDLREKRTEIVLDGLPKGVYLVVHYSTEVGEIRENDYHTISLVHSNEMALLNQANSKNGVNEYCVYNKNNGKVIQDAEVRFYSLTYDYKTYENVSKFVSKVTSGVRGEFTFNHPKDDQYYREYRAWIIKENDTLVIPVSRPYSYGANYRDNYRTFLYTDRAIYRPGQTVYFKGIVVKDSKNDKDVEVVKDYKSSVSFLDVNGQNISILNVTTNEYGSFSGSFTAPSSGLTGQMTISTTYGSASINVEEYKRPKFQVTFPTVDSSYRFMETVQVKGKAESYTGAAIDNAMVKYRVKRQVYFPYWRWWYRWSVPNYSTDSYITQGQTETNEKGEFTIPFIAYPDGSVLQQFQPVYSYIVEVDVTDNVGETRSGIKSISVSSYALTIATSLSNNGLYDKRKPIEFTIYTTNINGGFEAANGSYEIIKVPESSTPKTTRPFEKPNTFLISKEQFDSLFPYQEYTNVIKPPIQSYDWGKSPLKFTNSETESKHTIPTSSLSSGEYAVKISATDKFGNTIEEYAMFTLYDQTDIKATRTSFVDVIPLKSSYKPGENASFLVSSSLDDVTVYIQVEKDAGIVKRQIVKLNKSQQVVEFPVTEDDLGGFVVHLQSINKGVATIVTKSVSVPHATKNLQVKTRSFRDKTKPGAGEEWEIEVLNNEEKPLIAEVVASMYDASLDQFLPSYWYGLQSFLKYFSYSYRTSPMSFSSIASQYSLSSGFKFSYPYHYGTNYSDLQMYNLYLYQNRYGRYPGLAYRKGSARTMSVESEDALNPAPAMSKDAVGGALAESPKSAVAREEANEKEQETTPKKEVQVRKNLNETAFFYPHLKTDSLGRLKIAFTMPEALTTWNFRAVAHTPSVQSGMVAVQTITQKELMVQPALPRFLRIGDTIEIPMKISNLTDSSLSGTASLQLKDPITEQDVSAMYTSTPLNAAFSVPAKQSTSVSFRLIMNDSYNALQITGIAETDKFSDAEQTVLPVLTNRMLVTEAMPMPLKAKQERTFTFADMKRAFGSTTMKPHRFTLEVTSNPIWYAIQALPFLMEYPHECAEQLFSRFYANSIGLKIINDNPDIEKVFDVWKKVQPSAFQSNLQKNQELKSVLLEETPWLNEGKDESERKKRVALFFDRSTMNQSLASAQRKLQQMQLPNGAFTWFPGMKENRWMTQHILAGLGKLRNMGIKNVPYDMFQPATNYILDQIEEDYNWLVRNKTNLNQENISYNTLHSMYAVSFFTDIDLEKRKGFNYFLDQAKKYWRKKDFYSKGLSALVLQRFNEKKEAQLCFESLKEFSTVNDEMGRYFKDNRSGWYWYQAPIENQALMIEVFNDVGKDSTAVEELKTWLLKQKQTTDWKTTKATTEAIYSLMNFGVKLLKERGIVSSTVAGVAIDPKKDALDPIELGTGYYKVTWQGAKSITEDMATVTLSNPNNVVTWGAMYWQYFEDMSKIQPSKTNLSLKKQLFIETVVGSKKVLTPVTSVTPIKIGDKIISRIELKTDRNLEYVHLKDMRGSGFEPLNVLSQYKWQDGFGYYESTKDVATHFFIDYLDKGSYVFEYPLRATTRGGFDNGIATIQCMYAPEFTSHSEGIRVQIK
jgi:uncharacterized protein YfaS (alpha-2-macroglobulin family)